MDACADESLYAYSLVRQSHLLEIFVYIMGYRIGQEKKKLLWARPTAFFSFAYFFFRQRKFVKSAVFWTKIY